MEFVGTKVDVFKDAEMFMEIIVNLAILIKTFWTTHTLVLDLREG